jgi:tetratricopeptide (TPR) repeat protein
MAQYAASQGDWARAIDLLQPAADFGLEIGHPLGRQLQAQIEAWRAQLEGGPADLSPTERRAALEQAIPQLREAGDRENLGQALMALAQTCAQIDDWACVQAAAEELLAMGASDAAVWTLLGDAHSNLQDEPRAAEAYAQAVALAPDEAMLRRNYASTLIALGRLDDAATQIDAAEALEPDAPYLALHRANLAKARGDRPTALHWAQEALRRQPNWEEPRSIADWATGEDD